MKKALKVIVPIVLALAIVATCAWYLMIYDRDFTRDTLLSLARYNDSKENHMIATWLYNLAYAQAGNDDNVAIELANQYVTDGNYTKAEFTLSGAIEDGGGVEVYIALCKTYLQQDKVRDAVEMLNMVTDPVIKEQLDAMRPAAPTSIPETGYYNQYISVELQSQEGTIYATLDDHYPSLNTDTYADPITLHDGENNLAAVVISENGLVSSRSLFGYTIGGIVELMNFTDAAMERDIRTALNVDENKELYTNDLWKITEFVIPQDATSYHELQHMIHLKSLTIENGNGEELSSLAKLVDLEVLTITNTAISQDQLTAIAALPSLRQLTLRKADLSGIAPLKGAVNLESLDISDNIVRNLESLADLTKLQKLCAEHNAIEDLSPLAASANLTELDVSNNSITTLAPIAGATKLTKLDASVNLITQLGDLSALTALNTADLHSNKLTAIDALSACTALTELSIASNEIVDLSPLTALLKLMHLDFNHNLAEELPDFDDSCALVSIDGSHNLLESLSGLKGLQNLNTVTMDYNENITSVEALANCPVLTQVNIYGTKVTNVTALTDQSILVNYNPVQD